MPLIWAAIFVLVALASAAFGFIDLPASASEIARILFYIVLAIFLLVLVAGLILVRKAKSFARTFGINLSWTWLMAIMRYAQFFRKGRGKSGR
ncbi:MAG: DUF1328 domain-containing protein [Pseudobdellovibrionaceae bacterium]|nr:DUF1328 domain-containing protein [Pseudobdellovibrionaceae bacterium]